jgi:hypothetical protein
MLKGSTRKAKRCVSDSAPLAWSPERDELARAVPPAVLVREGAESRNSASVHQARCFFLLYFGHSAFADETSREEQPCSGGRVLTRFGTCLSPVAF